MDTATRRTVIAPTFPWRTVGLIVVIIALLVAATAVVIIGSQPSSRPAPPFGPAGNGLVAYTIDGDLFLRDPRGGPARKVTDTHEFDTYPSYSRDGTHIAFWRLNVDPNTNPEGFTNATVYVAKADGSEQRPIFTNDDLWGMSWSVDGSQVALIGEDDGQRSLYVVNVADGTSRELALNVEPVAGVQWRPPDGDEIIFLGHRGSTYAIYGIRADDGGLRKISADGNNTTFQADFAVTPDGNKLLYTDLGDDAEGDLTVDIRMLDLDTSEDTLWGGALPDPVVNGVSYTGLEHWGAPTLSADGKTVAFGRYWDDASSTLYHQVFVATLASDGADARPIGESLRSRGGHNPFAYGFAPDGQRLIVWYNERELTLLADPTDGSYELLPWGRTIDPPNWQRVAAE